LSKSISPLGAISTVPSASWRAVIGRYTAALFLASSGADADPPRGRRAPVPG
jgi:hypothetical protein